MTSDNQLESQCAQLLARNAEALRAEALHAIVLPNIARLRAGNNTPWNAAGWYATLTDAQLDAFLGARLPFPIAHDDQDWYAAETDSRSGTVFRFFQRRAWINVPSPARRATLHVPIVHVVMPEALQKLVLTVNGASVDYVQNEAPGHAAMLTLDVDAARLAQAGSLLRIGFHTPVAAMPALIYPDSSDRRLLSLAVAMPTWREA